MFRPKIARWLLAIVPLTALSAADRSLQWDAMEKTYYARPGESSADFTFTACNLADAPIVVTAVETSCRCTQAQFSSAPCQIGPRQSAQLHATVRFPGQWGEITKIVYVESSVGSSQLTLKIEAPDPAASTMPLREHARAAASANRQAVFTDQTCLACHAAPAKGKQGPELYAVVCGICHESPHRASMVPDLEKIAADRRFWRQWVEKGKEGTLMPAFEKAAGGPLDDAQIESLVTLLTGRGVTFKAAAEQKPAAAK